jgi:alpha-ketoglutarate-dependent taurine dioxygenase
MAIQSKITVQPITPPPGFNYNIGAELRNADLENLSDADFEVIHHALYTHQVILFKGQQTLSPKAQYELTQRFDPAAQTYGHGKTLDAKRSILHPDLKTSTHRE